MEFLCFNHRYPLDCLIIKREFKTRWGKVNREDITVRCPECGMEKTHSILIRGYKKGGN